MGDGILYGRQLILVGDNLWWATANFVWAPANFGGRQSLVGDGILYGRQLILYGRQLILVGDGILYGRQLILVGDNLWWATANFGGRQLILVGDGFWWTGASSYSFPQALGHYRHRPAAGPWNPVKELNLPDFVWHGGRSRSVTRGIPSSRLFAGILRDSGHRGLSGCRIVPVLGRSGANFRQVFRGLLVEPVPLGFLKVQFGYWALLILALLVLHSFRCCCCHHRGRQDLPMVAALGLLWALDV